MIWNPVSSRSDSDNARLFDVFISHASEDKHAVARPLAEALRRRGLKVWLDEDQLLLGDSIREELERGLASSHFGIVILSPNYFRKRWALGELDSLTARQMADGQSLIFPVWHNVGLAEVQECAPLLAGRLAVSSSLGVERVAEQVQAAIRRRRGVETGPSPATCGEIETSTATPLRELAGREEIQTLAEVADGAVRVLAVASEGGIVIGRAFARQLHPRARAALEQRGQRRVHWVTHWDDAGLNQVSLLLEYRAVGRRQTLTIANLTNYSPRGAAVGVIEPIGRSHFVDPGDSLEHLLAAEPTALVVVLGWGSDTQRLLHLAFEPVSCGGVVVPTFRSEGTAFFVPPEDPERKLVRFLGVWIPMTESELQAQLEEAASPLEVRFTRDSLLLTYFLDRSGTVMVAGAPELGQPEVGR